MFSFTPTENKTILLCARKITRRARQCGQLFLFGVSSSQDQRWTMAKKTKKKKKIPTKIQPSVDLVNLLGQRPREEIKIDRFSYIQKGQHIRNGGGGCTRRMSKQPELTCHSHTHTQSKRKPSKKPKEKNNTQKSCWFGYWSFVFLLPTLCSPSPIDLLLFYAILLSLPPHLPSKENAPQHFLSCSRNSYDNQVVSYHQRVSCRYDDYNNNHFCFYRGDFAA